MSELRVYGQSDDNICVEGPKFSDEFGGGDDPTKVYLSDGTILEIKYGKTLPDGSEDVGIWSIKTVKAGGSFLRIEECFDSDAKIYSDIAYFDGGVYNACVHVQKADGEKTIQCPECYHTFEMEECTACGVLVGK